MRPSKKLIDAVASLFKGNEDFILLDDQIIAYETICYEARNKSRTKKVIIVEGGPGTGKSVVSLNVFNSLIADEKSINFVAPNAAFRNVIVEMLTKGKVGTKSYLSNLFKGSAGYVDKPNNYFDVIIVDEAHRLKKKGAFMYRGENQVEDIIKSSAVSVFFVDDKQRVRPDDVGGVASIMEAAFKYGAEIKKIHLTAQFRCSGAEGYVNWITDVLQIEETANSDGWEAQDFDFQILDSPKDVHNIIKQRNEEGHDARILAGYAWPWTSAKKGNPDAEVSDIVIAEHGFEIPWNSRKAREYWAILPEGINQAGCIHTSQGLEFDYVGVLFGRDIKYNTSTGEVYGDYSSYYDTTGKKGMKETPDQLTKYIKNIYKVLCSRGMKGCYIYICDPKLRSYMKSRLNSARMNSDYDYVDSLSAELESVAEKPSEYNLSDSKEID